MPGARRQRSTLLAVAAAGVLAAAGCGGDDDKPAASTPTATTTATATGPTATRTSGKRTSPEPRRLTPSPKRAAVERTATLFVEGVERSDAGRVCRLLGRPPGTLEGCARAAGVNLLSVPSSDELSVEQVRISGRRASAALGGGRTMTLRRARSAWIVTGLRP